MRRRCAERVVVNIIRSRGPRPICPIPGKALDRSPNGIRLLTKTRITAGSQIDLRVDKGWRPGSFYLSGEVRWIKSTAKGYEAGVEFHDDPATDIAEWFQFQIC